MLLLTGGLIVILFHRMKIRSAIESRFFVLALTVILLAAFLFFEPRLRHHVFFSGRRILCAWPALILAATLELYWLAEKGGIGRWTSALGGILLASMAAHATLQFQPRTFYLWNFDAGAKQMSKILQTRPVTSGIVTVATSPILEHAMEFYRHRYALNWIAPIRSGIDCFHDYYVVRREDLSLLRRFDPVVLYRNEDAGTVLAATGPKYSSAIVELRQAGYAGTIGCDADLVGTSSQIVLPQPGVNSHLLHDVLPGAESEEQRWTLERPAYLLHAPGAKVRLRLHVRLAAETFRSTGPVRLTAWINGRRLGDERYTTAEDHVFVHDVPPEWLGPDGLSLVETTLDRYWIAPTDGVKLGYLFLSADLEKI